MEKETCTFSYCEKPEVIEVETDLLVIGGGSPLVELFMKLHAGQLLRESG